MRVNNLVNEFIKPLDLKKEEKKFEIEYSVNMEILF